MTPEDLKANLAQFTSTGHYYRWSVLFPNFVLTDGAKYLAEESGAYWLMDAIASHRGAYAQEAFVVARLDVLKDGTAQLTLDDGDGRVLAQQHIEYTDFPLEEGVLFVCRSEAGWVIMLSSEY